MTRVRPTLALLLAIAATGTAGCMSILAGWQRGGWLSERLVCVAVSLVLVMSAHLLPALIRDAPPIVRGIGLLLWGGGLVTVCYGHGVFFVTAQQHAGERRAASVPGTATPMPSRSLTAIMAERAAVTTQLASARSRYCTGNCVTLEGRRMTLAAKLDALDAEADDVRRIATAHDRMVAQRDALLTDPVTARLATLSGMTAARVELLSGLAFAAVLEGVACLLWTVSLRSSARPAPVPVAAEVTTPAVTPVTGDADVTHATVTSPAAAVATSRVTQPVSCDRSGHPARPDHPVTSQPVVDNDEVSRLAKDVAAGLVRPTVTGIRRHLGCSQARATALHRQIVHPAA